MPSIWKRRIGPGRIQTRLHACLHWLSYSVGKDTVVLDLALINLHRPNGLHPTGRSRLADLVQAAKWRARILGSILGADLYEDGQITVQEETDVLLRWMGQTTSNPFPAQGADQNGVLDPAELRTASQKPVPDAYVSPLATKPAQLFDFD